MLPRAEDPASPSKASNWNRLKQFVRKTDILTPVDHKRIWFEKMTRPPEKADGPMVKHIKALGSTIPNVTILAGIPTKKKGVPKIRAPQSTQVYPSHSIETHGDLGVPHGTTILGHL